MSSKPASGMIVYVDGMDFRRTGIGRVLERVLVELIESDRVSGIQTVVPATCAGEFQVDYGCHPKMRALFAGFGPFTPGDFLLKQRLINGFSPRADVSLFPNINVPLFPKGKFVFTVNDIIMMTSDSSWSPAKKYLFRTLTERALSRCSGLVCISDFTRSEVERVFGRGRASVRVIHPALGEEYLHADPEPYRRAPLVSGDYLLHVGIRVGHKNHAGLIRGWVEARKTFPSLKLVVAGKRLWEDDVDRLRRELSLGPELVELTGATDEQIRNLYANAKLFVFPSLAEGFGIPPLEAMAMGVPVICSDIKVLREVNGDAALYVDPRSPGEIGKGVVSVLSDRDLGGRLVAAGRTRSALFTRRRMTEGYVSFLEAICRAQ